MNKEIYILGIGHNTSVYIDLAEACGYEIKGLYHYNGDRTGDMDIECWALLTICFHYPL